MDFITENGKMVKIGSGWVAELGKMFMQCEFCGKEVKPFTDNVLCDSEDNFLCQECANKIGVIDMDLDDWSAGEKAGYEGRTGGAPMDIVDTLAWTSGYIEGKARAERVAQEDAPYGKIEVELSMREKNTLDELAKRIGTDPATVIRMALWDMALENEIEDGAHSSLSGPEWFK